MDLSPMSYPVIEVLQSIKSALARHNTVILQAPPGAGKSTVLPLHLLHEPWLDNKNIIMLEPRRLAAKSVAMRLAQLSGEDVGNTIGYRVRFENVVGNYTRLQVVTEGILTRTMQSNSTLENVGMIIFDEFHERSIHADLALVLCREIQNVVRSDLRVLIMSATLNAEMLSVALKDAPIITSYGKQFPVQKIYSDTNTVSTDTPLHLRITRVIRNAFAEQAGDILVFLPGKGEIHRVATQLEMDPLPARILPLYGELSFKKQQDAILPDPNGKRKIVLATSIAETSLTIEGISVVIDSGLSRVPRFDPRSGLTRLETIRVTQDAADQRAGRAGRLGPGVCYRLWPEGLQKQLAQNRKPEIEEADLAPLVLELSHWGVKNIGELSWITSPPAGAIAQAQDLLRQLGALEGDRITELGKKMAQLPTHPRIAKMLLESKTSLASAWNNCLAIDLAALLEERDPLPRGSGADITLRLEVLRRWRNDKNNINADQNALTRIERLAQAWRKLLKIDINNTLPSDAQVGKLLLSAYPDRLAKQLDQNGERYKLTNNRIVRLPPGDSLHREPWLAVAQVDGGTGEGKIFLAAPVDQNDLHHLARDIQTVDWDDDRGLVTAETKKIIGGLVISSKPLSVIPEKERVQTICDVVRKEGLKLLGWNDSHTSWQARVMSPKTWRPYEPWPEVTHEYLLNTIQEWLPPFLPEIIRRTELQRIDLYAILSSLIPGELRYRLDELAPAKLPVPSGSMIRIQYYADGRLPEMAVRLQEIFGLLQTPAINEGRTPIVLHLLSPGFRPVQVTQDLRSFWQNTYAEIRKELRRRYPKHAWPEDPYQAKAVRK